MDHLDDAQEELDAIRLGSAEIKKYVVAYRSHMLKIEETASRAEVDILLLLLLLLLLLYWKISGCGNDPKEPKDPSVQCRQTQESFLNTGIKTKLPHSGETRLT